MTRKQHPIRYNPDGSIYVRAGFRVEASEGVVESVRDGALSFADAIAEAECIYTASNRNLSDIATNTLPPTWKPFGKLWISPYLGSAMTLDMALKLEKWVRHRAKTPTERKGCSGC